MAAQHVEPLPRGRRDPESRHTPDAQRAVAAVAAAETALEAAREDRDGWIRNMAADGLTAPQIGRTLGLSTSLVRLVTRG